MNIALCLQLPSWIFKNDPSQCSLQILPNNCSWSRRAEDKQKLCYVFICYWRGMLPASRSTLTVCLDLQHPHYTAQQNRWEAQTSSKTWNSTVLWIWCWHPTDLVLLRTLCNAVYQPTVALWASHHSVMEASLGKVFQELAMWQDVLKSHVKQGGGFF